MYIKNKSKANLIEIFDMSIKQVYRGMLWFEYSNETCFSMAIKMKGDILSFYCWMRGFSTASNVYELRIV